MPPLRRITVERNRLRFAAAHMATFHGECEPLHGHNYDVMVSLEGDLTEDSWVWDFGATKRLVKEIIDPLDHRFILQRHSRVLAISESSTAWEVRFGERTYVFPREDVFLLEADNSTSERIAEWVAGELAKRLLAAGATHLHAVTVGIEEMPGQAGWYTVDMRAPGGSAQ